MKISAGTVTPTAVVIAAAAWACWSHLSPTEGPPAAKSKVVEVAARLLAPDLGSPRPRDPFRLPSDVSLERPTPAGGRTAIEAKLPEGWPARLRRLISTASARAKAGSAPGGRESDDRARTALAGLRLEATSVRDGRGVAIIGGRAYAEGDKLEMTDPALGAVILAEVRSGEVFLRCPGSQVVLRFPDVSATSTGAKPGTQAKAARPRRLGPGMVPSVKGKAR
jgi:hypothetical protein